ncbi:hypothetical protein E2C01_072633 [Portunus trituberculatus]|uniref:Uncharacterized protein n=1 Tax=Portunus trituberculatus TaxID=210409 RepID=A0A5B7HYJ9_PORTR|nr:hypothetical protein [Portunus trituberculatus]
MYTSNPPRPPGNRWRRSSCAARHLQGIYITPSIPNPFPAHRPTALRDAGSRLRGRADGAGGRGTDPDVRGEGVPAARQAEVVEGRQCAGPAYQGESACAV